MSDPTSDLDWWRERLETLRMIQPALEALTKLADHLLTPMIEILDEDRETLVNAMQGHTQWFDYQTVGHWIEEADDLAGDWK